MAPVPRRAVGGRVRDPRSPGRKTVPARHLCLHDGPTVVLATRRATAPAPRPSRYSPASRSIACKRSTYHAGGRPGVSNFEAWIYDLVWRYPRTTRYILVVILVACI